jgi:AcrR family transcriptional regulator
MSPGVHKTVHPQRQASDPSRRQRLLEAAGQVFAEQGFERATGKEICDRAGTNSAAINYYFGGMDGLYAAVLHEAHNHFVTFEDVAAAVAGKTGALVKLEAIMALIVRMLTIPVGSWALRVIGREIVAPSSALESLRENEFLPKMGILKAIVSELMGLPETHPAVARGCISVMAPCFLLLLFDRATLQRALPNLSLAPEDAAALARHLVTFAVAGLKGVAKDVRKEA